MSEPAILYAALHEKIGAELLNESRTAKQLRFMLRIKSGASTRIWLSVADRLLELGDAQVASGNPAWTIDISKQYFRRPDLKFGWRIILQGEDLSKYFAGLAREVRSVSEPLQDAREIPLYGSPNRKGGVPVTG